MTRACGTDWALGIEARARALASDGEAAETLFRVAIDRLGRTPLRVELGRAQLVYGEWLRRQQRIRDAGISRLPPPQGLRQTRHQLPQPVAGEAT